MKLRSKIITAVAAVAVVAAGSAGAISYVSAQSASPTPSAQTQNQGQAFLDKVAANLNISTDQLTTALKTASSQTVDEWLASGKITTAQATKLKTAITNGKGFTLLRFGRHANQAVARRLIITSSAKAINISPADLRTELKSGKSIAAVAGEHNVDLSTVKTQITTDAQAKLNQAFANHKITQARADAAMQKLNANLDTLLNKTVQKPAPAQ